MNQFRLSLLFLGLVATLTHGAEHDIKVTMRDAGDPHQEDGDDDHMGEFCKCYATISRYSQARLPRY